MVRRAVTDGGYCGHDGLFEAQGDAVTEKNFRILAGQAVTWAPPRPNG